LSFEKKKYAGHHYANYEALQRAYEVGRHALVPGQEKTVGKDGDYTEK
jgi:hypothetical protein